MLANQVFRKLKVLTNVNIFIMKTFITLLLLLSFGSVRAADLFIEAESFSNKGGWKVDQQFMDLMGSPYLLAHGMGVPVDDASTEVTFPEKGEYYVYVRTYNWTSPWKKGEGPGNASSSFTSDGGILPASVVK